METPPSSELKAAQQRLYKGASGLRPGTVILTSGTYPAAVSVGAETFALTDHGSSPVQNLRAVISKADLPTAPKQGQSIKVNGLAFKIVEVSGHNDGDESWHVSGQRTPGGDG